MTIPEQLVQLQSHPRYSGATMRPYFFGHLVTLPNVSLPSHWSHRSTNIMFYVPPGYPCARPSHFWTSDNVGYMREGYGSLPPRVTMAADSPAHDEKSPPEAKMLWLWTPTHWSANDDTLMTFANVIRMRFNELR